MTLTRLALFFFILFIIRIGQQIAKYKRAAEERGYISLSTFEQVNRQIQSALFLFEFVRDTWLEEKAAEEENFYDGDVDDDEDDEECDLDCSLGDIFMSRREIPAERNSCDNFLEDGKTNADKCLFRGLTSQFKLEDLGKKFNNYAPLEFLMS